MSGEPVPVTLNGAGDSDVVAELTSWQNELAASEQPVDLAYFLRGSKDGRLSLLGGRSDFAVSGAPFTDAELAGRPAGAGQIIEAPISISALSVLVTTPYPNEWNTEKLLCDPDDPDVPDPAACVERGVYTGPIRLPAENLAAIYLTLSPQFENNRLATWGDPAIEAAMGGPSLAITGASSVPVWVNRAEGSAITKSLMLYARDMAPTAWELRKREYPQFAWEPIGEQFGSRGSSRFGEDTLAGLIAISNVAPSGTVIPNWAGNMGAVGSRRVGRLVADYPNAQFRQVEVQNKNGDWVLPTREAIEASLAAGTATNLGATEAVPGAYPMTWVTRLYTVAGTLTPEKANALAASVRYMATDGQDAIVAGGGAPLPAALRAEALASADAIIDANCAADGYEVVVGGPSEFEPKSPGVEAIGQMKHCRAKPGASSTTTISTIDSTTTTTAASEPAAPTVAETIAPAPRPSGGSPSGARPSPSAGAAPTAALPEVETTTTVVAQAAVVPTTAAADVDDGAAGGAGTRPRGRPLGSLLYALPSDDAEGFKKLGTLLLGAALYLFGRRLVRARMIAT